MKTTFRYLMILLTAGLVLSACGKDEPEVKEDTTTFAFDDVPMVDAAGGTVEVALRTAVASFSVNIPSDAGWLHYVNTKAVENKTLVFTVDPNEEAKSRYTAVSFKNAAGTTIGKELTIYQKAGAGVSVEPEEIDILDPAGGSVTVQVEATVPFDVKVEGDADWLRVSGKTAQSFTLEVDENLGAEEREAELGFYREGGSDQINKMTVRQGRIVAVVFLNDKPYESLEAALEAAKTVEHPLLKITAETPLTHLHLDGADYPGGLTIDGEGVGVLASVEVLNLPLKLQNLTIQSQDSGVLAQLGDMVDVERGDQFKWEYGLFVQSAGHGLVLDHVTIDMSALDANATGIFLLGNGERGTERDLIQHSTIKGAGHRNMQIYGAFAEISDNSFTAPYSSYAIRLGYDANDVILSGNRFEGEAKAAVNFYGLSDSSITFGDGSADNNSASSTFQVKYNANNDPTAAGNSFAPEVYYIPETQELSFEQPGPRTLLTRVWSHYYAEDGWDDSVSSRPDWDRNAVMDDDYIWIPIAGTAANDYGVAIIDRASGELVKKVRDGFEAEGTFYTSAIARLDDGTVLISNMARNYETLKVYKMTSPDARPELVISYPLNGARYGDKMTAFGTLDDGVIFFCPYEAYNHDIKLLEFPISGGKISETPRAADSFGWSVDTFDDSVANHMNGLYPYIHHGSWSGDNSEISAVYAGTKSPALYARWFYGGIDGWYLYYYLWKSSQPTWHPHDGLGLDYSMLDPDWFWLGEQKYMCYVSYTGDGSHTSGFLRVLPIPASSSAIHENLANSLQQIGGAAALEAISEYYPLGGEKDLNAGKDVSSNGTGYCAVRYIGEELYILAGVTKAGMSLFKVSLPQ